MGKKCLKCEYERKSSDFSPDYECPKCGAIYEKVDAFLKQRAILDQHKKSTEPIKSQRKILGESQDRRVVITDIKMPFWSMVGFMVKWTIASIPALIILIILFSILFAIFSSFSGGT